MNSSEPSRKTSPSASSKSFSKLVLDCLPVFLSKTNSQNLFCLVWFINILVLSAILGMLDARRGIGRSALRNTHTSLQGVQIYAPMQHIRRECHVRVSRDNFKILGHEKDKYLLKVKEIILISTTRPKLNGSVTSVPLALFSSWMTRIFWIFVISVPSNLYDRMFVYISPWMATVCVPKRRQF